MSIFTIAPATWTNDLPVPNANTFNKEIHDRLTDIDTNVVDKTTAQTLTNKTLTGPVINSPTGIVKADVGLSAVDNTSDATKNAATVTLTNKTLTTPVINGATGDATVKKGVINAVSISAGDTLIATVSFGTTFATIPVVVACTYNPSYANTFSGATVLPTTTGFTCWIHNYGTVNALVGISWIAVGTI